MAKSVGEEIVVVLSTQIDNAGLQKLFSLLDTTKLKALGVAGAISGLTTATYKFLQAMTKKEFEYEKLARQQSKSIQNTRVEQEALSAMGMTLNEIKKDKALQTMYEDLVKFNKELKMPNMKAALESVNRLRLEFWKLKSAVSNAVQYIGAQVLTNLEMPMDRVGGRLKTAAEWIRDRLPSISTKLSSFITAFAKGIIGVGETIGKIFKFVNELPDGIKSVGLAIGGLFLLLKTGPVGQILGLITAAGDVIHDYENYLWNKNNKTVYRRADGTATKNANEAATVNGEPELYKVGIAFEDIWEILADEGKGAREKSSKIFETILGNVLGGLGDAINALNSGDGSGLREWVSKLTGPLGEAIGGIIDYVKSDEGKAKLSELVTELFTTISSLLTKAGDIGVDVTGAMAEMIGAIFGGANWEEAWSRSKVSEFLSGNNGFATGLSTAIETAFAGGNFLTSILTGAISTYQKERNKTLRGLYEQDKDNPNFDMSDILFGEDGLPTYLSLEKHYGKDENNLNRVAEGLAASLQDDFNGLLGATLEILTGGISFVSSGAGDILETLVGGIVNAIFGTTGTGGKLSENVTNALGSEKAKTMVDSIATGIGTWIISGNFFGGLLGGVTSFLNENIQKSVSTGTPLWDVISEEAEGFWQTILDIWYGPLENPDLAESETNKRQGQYGLASVIMPLLEGQVEEVEKEGKKYREKNKGGGLLGWLFGYDEYAEFEILPDGTERKVESSVKHVKGIFEKAWSGEDGKGGIKSFLEPIGDAIIEWAKGLMDNLWIAMYNGMPDWLKTGIEVLLGKPINNPNKSTIEQDKDGNYQLKSTNEKTLPLTKEQAELLEQRNKRMEELEGHGILDQIYTENGVVYFNSSSNYVGQKVIDENGEFTEEASAWLNLYKTFNQLDEAKEAARYNERRGEAIREAGSDASQWSREEAERVERRRQEALARESGRIEGGQTVVNAEELAKAESALIDLMHELGVVDREGSDGTRTYYTGDMLPEEKSAIEDAFGAFYELAGKKLSQWSYDDQFNLVYNPNNTGDQESSDGTKALQQQSEAAAKKLSLINGSAGSASSSIVSLDSSVQILDADIGQLHSELSQGTGSNKKAWGGRIGSEMNNVTVGEDGTEYIIPITKPDRAFALINQMLNEMGSSAIERVVNGLGMGRSGTIGSSAMSLDTAFQGMSMVNNYNISAPVSINVNSSSASAEDIGNSVYNAAERHLVKTLRGA